MDILKAKNLYMRAKEAYYNSGDSIMPDRITLSALCRLRFL